MVADPISFRPNPGDGAHHNLHNLRRAIWLRSDASRTPEWNPPPSAGWRIFQRHRIAAQSLT
jgi:hypothetical protein